jgi:uncharacterized protein YuzB (UPF0349 family)
MTKEAKEVGKNSHDCRPVINYCLRNVDLETRVLLRNSDFYVIEDFCLHRCGQCYDGPFLVVNGQEIAACSHRDILESLSK